MTAVKKVGATKRRRSSPFHLIIILSALCMFEVFSYSTSYESLFGLIGVSSWAKSLSWAFVALDFGGIARMFITDGSDNQDFIWYLGAAWVITAAADTWLTFFSIQMAMKATAANQIMIQSGLITERTFTVTIPIMFAILIFVIQVALVVTLTSLVEKQLKGRSS